MVINVIKSCYIPLITIKSQQQQNGRDERIQTCCIPLVTAKKKMEGVGEYKVFSSF